MANLKDYLTPQAKSKIKAGEWKAEGKCKFFTSSPIQSKHHCEPICEMEEAA